MAVASEDDTLEEEEDLAKRVEILWRDRRDRIRVRQAFVWCIKVLVGAVFFAGGLIQVVAGLGPLLTR